MLRRRLFSSTGISFIISISLLVFELLPQRCLAQATPGLDPILQYIAADWDVLTRSMTLCDSVVDPKLPEAALLYLPANFPEPDSVKQLEQTCKVHVLHLPVIIQHPGQADVGTVAPQGLLFLPNSYVVPGGRFNEMYGWDSYFIILGLLHDRRIELARGMVENFFFEIEHYGTILNANRTYYLTRSQPPFLTSMIMEVYNAQKAAGHDDKIWLARAYEFAERDYEMWTHEPHLAGSTGLSRYYDFGSGPAAEGAQDEAGLHRKVAGYFVMHPELARTYVVVKDVKQQAQTAGPEFNVQVCDAAQTMAHPGCDDVATVGLTADYYKGDRSMRESGFDISFRFEPYGAATHHFAPVCLNSLLYKTEKDLEEISRLLDKTAQAEQWKQRAEQRKERINRYLWDDQRGLFFDYDLRTESRSTYEYLTTFYPLWAGLSDPQQARAVARNAKVFEQPGGLATSPNDTGVQWDYPYGWAPLQLLAVEGLRRYGFTDDANRISYEFLSTVAENFKREGTIREKYDVVTRSSDVQVSAGYQANVVGFGWTNGVFLQLLQDLPKEMIDRLAREQDRAPQSSHE
ncbi:MAG: trehalase family glycosidase [Terriglobales bacterium]|jgi:alpha,alpha-trehalase